jgi:hypothetical protein
MDRIKNSLPLILLIANLIFVQTLFGVEKKTGTIVKKVDGINNAVATLSEIEMKKYAVIVWLEEGIYLIKHEGGGVKYHQEAVYKEVPTVFVYSMGGKDYPNDSVINLKTDTIVMGTLNYQGDDFIVEVKTKGKRIPIYLFIWDGRKDDNSGHIQVSITRRH